MEQMAIKLLALAERILAKREELIREGRTNELPVDWQTV
jgi:hypothetical protein